MANPVMVMAHIAPHIPSEMIPMVAQKIQTLPEEKLSMLMAIPLKDPVMVTVLASLLGSWGVDRFYIGQIGLGIAKVLTCGGLGIWTLVNVFLAGPNTKKENYKTLMMYLA